MWTSTLDLSPKRVLLTNLLGRFWRGAYFSSFAPLCVENVPRQPLPDNSWVRVRNRLAGICGSDLHLIYADGDLRVAPAALPGNTMSYLGHEVVGEVIEIGDDVHQLKVGDRVALQHGLNCLSAGVQPLCRFCASGNYNLCERGSLPGPHPIGGGWSEEMLLHEQQLFRIPNSMSDTQAVLLEPSAVALHTVLRHVPQSGDRVLIIGAGTIGLLTLQIVRALAPQAEISVQARYPFQVEKATRMGAAHIIYPQDSYTGVKQATHATLYKGMLGNQTLLGGYDVIYDTIGTQKTLHDALRWARAQSTVVLVGLSLHLMHIDLTPIWHQQIDLIGTMGHGMETWPLDSHLQRPTFSIVADMMMHGVIQPEQLITHHFALNNYRQALLTAIDKREQRAIKVVFDYSMLPASVVPNVRASARRPRQNARETRQNLIPAPNMPERNEPLPVVPGREQAASVRPIPPNESYAHTLLVPKNASISSLDTHNETQVTEPPYVNEAEQAEYTLPVQDEQHEQFEHYEHSAQHEQSEQSYPAEEPSEDKQVQELQQPAENELNAAVEDEHTPSSEQPFAEEQPLATDDMTPMSPSTGHMESSVMEDAVQAVQSDAQLAFDEEPLNELEWLDVMQEEQNVLAEMEYVPDAEQTHLSFEETVAPEEVWFEQEPSFNTGDFPRENVAVQESFEDESSDGRFDEQDTENDTIRHPSIKPLSSTKVTKAVGRYRTKGKNKGKSATGSLRS